jgi:hypothetical protein
MLALHFSSGTMLFGESTNASSAATLLNQAAGSGVNFFDTAEMYPVPQRPETQGVSEAILGSWMRSKCRYFHNWRTPMGVFCAIAQCTNFAVSPYNISGALFRCRIACVRRGLQGGLCHSNKGNGPFRADDMDSRWSCCSGCSCHHSSHRWQPATPPNRLH